MVSTSPRLPLGLESYPDPTLILYHARCPDGFGSAWVYWQQYGARAQYVPVGYGEPVPDVSGHDVVVVDFSFPRATLLDMKAQANSLRLLDHHASAIEDLVGLPFAYFDINRSGVGLAWQDLHGDTPPPMLVRCVEDRDIYQWKVPGSRNILHMLDVLPYRFEAWEEFSQRLESDLIDVMSDGALMRQRFESAAQRMLCNARAVEMGGMRGLAVNAPMEFADEVGNALAKQADFGFTWYLDKAGQVHGSWRSCGPNVIGLARLFGGGGHPRSAGARLSLAQLTQALSLPPG